MPPGADGSRRRIMTMKHDGVNGGEDVLQTLELSADLRSNVLRNEVIGPLILEALDGFLLVVKCDGNVSFVSDNVTNYLHFTPSELVGRSIYSLIHADDQPQFEQRFTVLSSNARNATSNNSSATPNVSIDCRLLIKTDGNGAATDAVGMLSPQQQLQTVFKPINLTLILHHYPSDGSGRMSNGNSPAGGTSAESDDYFLACIGRRINVVDRPPVSRSTVSVGASHGRNSSIAKSPGSSSAGGSGGGNNSGSSELSQFVTKQDLGGKILDCDASVDMVSSGLIGHNIQEFCHATDLSQMNRHYMEVVKVGMNLSGVYRFHMPHGQYVFIQTKSKLFQNQSTGQPEFIMSTHSVVRPCDKESELNGPASNCLMRSLMDGFLSDRSRLGDNRPRQQTSPRSSNILSQTIDASSSGMPQGHSTISNTAASGLPSGGSGPSSLTTAPGTVDSLDMDLMMEYLQSQNMPLVDSGLDDAGFLCDTPAPQEGTSAMPSAATPAAEMNEWSMDALQQLASECCTLGIASIDSPGNVLADHISQDCCSSGFNDITLIDNEMKAILSELLSPVQSLLPAVAPAPPQPAAVPSPLQTPAVASPHPPPAAESHQQSRSNAPAASLKTSQNSQSLLLRRQLARSVEAARGAAGHPGTQQPLTSNSLGSLPPLHIVSTASSVIPRISAASNTPGPQSSNSTPSVLLGGLPLLEHMRRVRRATPTLSPSIMATHNSPKPTPTSCEQTTSHSVGLKDLLLSNDEDFVLPPKSAAPNIGEPGGTTAFRRVSRHLSGDIGGSSNASSLLAQLSAASRGVELEAGRPRQLDGKPSRPAVILKQLLEDRPDSSTCTTAADSTSANTDPRPKSASAAAKAHVSLQTLLQSLSDQDESLPAGNTPESPMLATPVQQHSFIVNSSSAFVNVSRNCGMTGEMTATLGQFGHTVSVTSTTGAQSLPVSGSLVQTSVLGQFMSSLSHSGPKLDPLLLTSTSGQSLPPSCPPSASSCVPTLGHYFPSSASLSPAPNSLSAMSQPRTQSPRTVTSSATSTGQHIESASPRKKSSQNTLLRQLLNHSSSPSDLPVVKLLPKLQTSPDGEERLSLILEQTTSTNTSVTASTVVARADTSSTSGPASVSASSTVPRAPKFARSSSLSERLVALWEQDDQIPALLPPSVGHAGLKRKASLLASPAAAADLANIASPQSVGSCSGRRTPATATSRAPTPTGAVLTQLLATPSSSPIAPSAFSSDVSFIDSIATITPQMTLTKNLHSRHQQSLKRVHEPDPSSSATNKRNKPFGANSPSDAAVSSSCLPNRRASVPKVPSYASSESLLSVGTPPTNDVFETSDGPSLLTQHLMLDEAELYRQLQSVVDSSMTHAELDSVLTGSNQLPASSMPEKDRQAISAIQSLLMLETSKAAAVSAPAPTPKTPVASSFPVATSRTSSSRRGGELSLMQLLNGGDSPQKMLLDPLLSVTAAATKSDFVASRSSAFHSPLTYCSSANSPSTLLQSALMSSPPPSSSTSAANQQNVALLVQRAAAEAAAQSAAAGAVAHSVAQYSAAAARSPAAVAGHSRPPSVSSAGGDSGHMPSSNCSPAAQATSQPIDVQYATLSDLMNVSFAPNISLPPSASVMLRPQTPSSLPRQPVPPSPVARSPIASFPVANSPVARSPVVMATPPRFTTQQLIQLNSVTGVTAVRPLLRQVAAATLLQSVPGSVSATLLQPVAGGSGTATLLQSLPVCGAATTLLQSVPVCRAPQTAQLVWNQNSGSAVMTGGIVVQGDLLSQLNGLAAVGGLTVTGRTLAPRQLCVIGSNGTTGTLGNGSTLVPVALLPQRATTFIPGSLSAISQTVNSAALRHLVPVTLPSRTDVPTTVLTPAGPPLQLHAASSKAGPLQPPQQTSILQALIAKQEKFEDVVQSPLLSALQQISASPSNRSVTDITSVQWTSPLNSVSGVQWTSPLNSVSGTESHDVLESLLPPYPGIDSQPSGSVGDSLEFSELPLDVLESLNELNQERIDEQTPVDGINSRSSGCGGTGNAVFPPPGALTTVDGIQNWLQQYEQQQQGPTVAVTQAASWEQSLAQLIGGVAQKPEPTGRWCDRRGSVPAVLDSTRQLEMSQQQQRREEMSLNVHNTSIAQSNVGLASLLRQNVDNVPGIPTGISSHQQQQQPAVLSSMQSKVGTAARAQSMKVRDLFRNQQLARTLSTPGSVSAASSPVSQHPQPHHPPTIQTLLANSAAANGFATSATRVVTTIPPTPIHRIASESRIAARPQARSPAAATSHANSNLLSMAPTTPQSLRHPLSNGNSPGLAGDAGNFSPSPVENKPPQQLQRSTSILQQLLSD